MPNTLTLLSRSLINLAISNVDQSLIPPGQSPIHGWAGSHCALFSELTHPSVPINWPFIPVRRPLTSNRQSAGSCNPKPQPTSVLSHSPLGPWSTIHQPTGSPVITDRGAWPLHSSVQLLYSESFEWAPWPLAFSVVHPKFNSEANNLTITTWPMKPSNLLCLLVTDNAWLH